MHLLLFKIIFQNLPSKVSSNILLVICIILLSIIDAAAQYEQSGVYKQIGVQCIFQQGSKQSCKEYCSEYFKQQPQLAWYNITSNNCQPLKICSFYLHFYNYATNQCYVDKTMTKIADSEYPETLTRQVIATFYMDIICVNGQVGTGNLHDVPCDCFFMWESSGTIDLNGFPYRCDKLIAPQKWKGYFFNQLITQKNGTVVMYGQYTPQQLQILYQNLKVKQKQQTLSFIYKYEQLLLDLITNELPQESVIREVQIGWVIMILAFSYMVFAFSYVRYENQIIKVSKKQLIQRIQSIIQNRKAYENTSKQ